MGKTLLTILLLACLLGFGLTLRRGEGFGWSEIKKKVRQRFPEVRQISPAELADRLASGDRPPMLLDVRREEEYRVSHLRGAVRVEPGAEEPVLPAGVTRKTPIVTYCSVGFRSASLAERLTKLGYRDVSNLEGSIFAWANEGRPVYRDGQEVREVHPFDARWGRLLDRKLHATSP